MAFLARGTGPRHLTFLPGNLCTVHSWSEVLRRLPEPEYRCLAVDYLVGSDRPWGGWTVSGIADLTRDVLDTSGVSRTVLVGHSAGGLAALLFALRFPERLAGLVVVASGARMTGHRTFDGLAEALSRPEVPQGFLERALTGMWSVPPPVEVLVRDLGLLGAVRERMRDVLLSCADYDLRGQLGSLSVPTLVCQAELDRGRPLAHGQELAEGIPGAQLVRFDTGHMIPLEDPAGLAHALRVFVGTDAWDEETDQREKR